MHVLRIEQPAGAIEQAVLDDQRDIVDAVFARQIECAFLVIADVDRCGEPRIDLRSRAAMQMRMIPV
jgi:hypothetical protein